MKKYLIYLAAGAALMASCDDDFTRPPLVMPPTVTVEPTTTLADFKTNYWGTLNAPTTIEMDEQGDSVIFKGRVCSSDESGNIYKNLIIQGTNADGEQVALTFAINATDIYQTLPFGQEVAVYATGLSVGPYRGLLQFGSISGDQMTFMDESTFTEHVIRTGSALPDPSKVDTTATTIAEVMAAKSTSDGMRLWQSRLVRVQGVTFEDAGQPFSGTTTTNRYIRDAEGNRMIVRNSAYASFAGDILPGGTGDVVGILSYFNPDWQILLIDAEGLIGFDPNAVPDTPTTVEPAGEGTLESPYNVTKALDVIEAGPSENQVYITGKITSIKEIDTASFGNATYFIGDEGSTETLEVFRGYSFNGDKFTSADQLEVGATVVIKGVLVNYMGNTPEVTQGSQLISYNGQGTGGGGDTPTPVEGALYSALGATDSELSAGWTFDNVSLPEGATYIWSWKEYNGSHYLNGSAFVNKQALASEAYAVSPVIDLTGATGCAVTFEHAAKFQTTLKELCAFVVRLEGATEWTALTIPEWPAEGGWTFVNSGNIDLSAYDGKKIQLAFKYGSTTAGADTWEIKNLIVTGSK